MTHEEAVHILEMIKDAYPKFPISKGKATLLIPSLKKMDYNGVMEKFSDFAANHPYAPMIAEIASYPLEPNLYLEKMNKWKREADKVPAEIKENFRQAMHELIKEKSQS
ncbi:replicative helicase loader/inhibitor [Virgibacillus oceani]|uniref:Replicative helicase inhibitor G39P N-terminal domain-containing protein n=1 Tax=Virgibacillus oceani TaxID=1479511 RepID=A0A917M6W4_9BACI|nr:replicative helicase loader/inhibitor [Virgibacillus oceani]GGG81238.1 hypothetical protein GCM10011398_28300 [Virgibacillus oceani]